MLVYLYWGLIGIVLSEYVQLISDRGSFLSSIFGRSTCDHCKKIIPWYAMIPFVGAAVTKGKCIHCDTIVPKKYFWFELIYSIFWLASLYVIVQTTLFSIPLYFVFLLFYAATALLMYEDLKNFSVPVSWLAVWSILTVAIWYLLNYRELFFWDTALMVVVLLLSLSLMVLIKKLPFSAITDLFGGADVIVLLLVCLLFGFQAVTAILLGSIVLSLIYLIVVKKRKSDKRIPLLTMLMPWIVVALLVL